MGVYVCICISLWHDKRAHMRGINCFPVKSGVSEIAEENLIVGLQFTLEHLLGGNEAWAVLSCSWWPMEF